MTQPTAPTMGDITGDNTIDGILGAEGTEEDLRQDPRFAINGKPGALLPDFVTDPNQQIYRSGAPINVTQSDHIPGYGRVGQVPIANVTNDVIQGIANGGPAVRAAWLSKLAQAGLIDGAINMTLWDDSYTDLLVNLGQFANGNGMLLQEAISHVGQQRRSLAKAQGGGGGGGGGVKIPAFAPPDPATLAQSVKRTLRQTLGRDPQQDELDALSAELSTYARQAYDAQITQMQGGTAADVDPQARFAEMIESKYANELSLLDQRDDNAAGVAMAQKQTSFIDRVLGGV